MPKNHYSRTHWKQPKRSSLLRDRRQRLELMLGFANFDIQAVGTTVGKALVVTDYLESLRLKIDDPPTATDVIELQRLQSRLRKRLSKIIQDSVQLWEMPQWVLRGRLQLSINVLEGRFSESFIPEGAAQKEGFSKGRALTDFKLYELIHDLDLHPKRFRKCPHCNKLFYQPTARVKLYCSAGCAGAVRQARFRKRMSTRSATE